MKRTTRCRTSSGQASGHQQSTTLLDEIRCLGIRKPQNKDQCNQYQELFSKPCSSAGVVSTDDYQQLVKFNLFSLDTNELRAKHNIQTVSQIFKKCKVLQPIKFSKDCKKQRSNQPNTENRQLLHTGIQAGLNHSYKPKQTDCADQCKDISTRLRKRTFQQCFVESLVTGEGTKRVKLVINSQNTAVFRNNGVKIKQKCQSNSSLSGIDTAQQSLNQSCRQLHIQDITDVSGQQSIQRRITRQQSANQPILQSNKQKINNDGINNMIESQQAQLTQRSKQEPAKQKGSRFSTTKKFAKHVNYFVQSPQSQAPDVFVPCEPGNCASKADASLSTPLKRLSSGSLIEDDTSTCGQQQIRKTQELENQQYIQEYIAGIRWDSEDWLNGDSDDEEVNVCNPSQLPKVNHNNKVEGFDSQSRKNNESPRYKVPRRLQFQYLRVAKKVMTDVKLETKLPDCVANKDEIQRAITKKRDKFGRLGDKNGTEVLPGLNITALSERSVPTKFTNSDTSVILTLNYFGQEIRPHFQKARVRRIARGTSRKASYSGLKVITSKQILFTTNSSTACWRQTQPHKTPNDTRAINLSNLPFISSVKITKPEKLVNLTMKSTCTGFGSGPQITTRSKRSRQSQQSQNSAQSLPFSQKAQQYGPSSQLQSLGRIICDPSAGGQ